MIPKKQRTVARPVHCSGIGMHSGKRVQMAIKPAPVNYGIRFKRVDLPESPSICAHINSVVDTSLATVIGHEGLIVSTIEHLMASFAGLAIDNALVEVDAYEVPIMDGSAGPFTASILEAGIQEQDSPKCFFVVKKPIALCENGKSVVLHPDSEFRISCRIHYDHPVVQSQFFSLALTEKGFGEEIAEARTYGFLQEIEYLQLYGFAKGASLENAVVIDADRVLNTDGLRWKDEFVRHKILDCLGDFSLLGMPILGHLEISKSGHAFNHAFLKTFFKRRDAWETSFIADP
ncbi:MAG: UDP-3-O-acyl-N-acetylglucosamine deacetylase [Deltaproteobacteria bacterium]|nr:UDP-3-O-acyl-N-acetylglucosamine deacetylase [Deltaproteobacteria bacterium]MBW1954098.1 UDP-3-O-acyl-N-acetylglucosamine deacetylase [Deltaproteobacteria bacterium]MBW2040988.1 UDP-3-O-acyl-N-acetylglucosamine deacetylase [Deltaproteobacteria bacterium]MBW2131293.1 UDP-3-O-acyl-N-acetylglucosamine deacetylase [Deltaproteobacteria bacterium]